MKWNKRREELSRFLCVFFAIFFLLFFRDGWKMNVSLKRQLQRSLIKNKSVAFLDSSSSRGSAKVKSLKLYETDIRQISPSPGLRPSQKYGSQLKPNFWLSFFSRGSLQSRMLFVNLLSLAVETYIFFLVYHRSAIFRMRLSSSANFKNFSPFFFHLQENLIEP